MLREAENFFLQKKQKHGADAGFFLTLASPKIVVLGNKKKSCFPFVFLSFFTNFVAVEP